MNLAEKNFLWKKLTLDYHVRRSRCNTIWFYLFLWTKYHEKISSINVDMIKTLFALDDYTEINR
jgi:hypothetical protein